MRVIKMSKKLGIGIDDFRRAREDDYYILLEMNKRAFFVIFYEIIINSQTSFFLQNSSLVLHFQKTSCSRKILIETPQIN